MAIEWIDREMQRWGKALRDGRGALGFPSQSAEVRAIEGSGAKDAADGFVPEDVARIERAVLAMDVDLQVVVKEFYMTGHSGEVVADRLSRKLKKKVSRQSLYQMIDRSHYFIDGYLFTGGDKKKLDLSGQ